MCYAYHSFKPGCLHCIMTCSVDLIIVYKYLFVQNAVISIHRQCFEFKQFSSFQCFGFFPGNTLWERSRILFNQSQEWQQHWQICIVTLFIFIVFVQLHCIAYEDFLCRFKYIFTYLLYTFMIWNMQCWFLYSRDIFIFLDFNSLKNISLISSEF